jgi:REP element-mobilizing transposase RayT
MKRNLPQRKHPRLKEYDYSGDGVYFITICTHNKKHLLSQIVGRGLAPAVELTDYGEISEQQLLRLKERFPFVEIDNYVIMPNHIHIIFWFKPQTAGASPRPTLTDVVCAYKSLTTQECKKIKLIDKLFQTSFHDHIIRNKHDYEEISKYIHENPLKWQFDELYCEE